MTSTKTSRAPAKAPLFAWTKTVQPSFGQADPVLLATVVALIAFGVVMVFSASAVFASQQRFTNHDGNYFLIRQGGFALISVPLMLLVSRIDSKRWQPLAYPILLITTGLMVATLFIGHSVGGATRWIQVGPVNIQAAELAKVAIVIYLAHSLSKKNSDQIRTFKVGILPHLIVLGVLAFLSYRQNDLGSAMMFGILTLVMLFAAGAKTGPIALIVLGATSLVAISIFSTSWRRGRIEAFLDPFGHRQGSGYQIVESILSFGSGGWTGVGLGDSRQKLFFLPEAHTDFISAIIGEELGFIGIVLLVCAFSLVVIRGFRAAFRAENEHASLLAVGITTFIGTSAFANLAVAMGLLPTKGLVLPFISYGGSSLLVCAGAMGIVLSVSRHAQRADEAVNASAAATNAPLELAGFPREKERDGSKDGLGAADDMVVAREAGMAAASEGSRIARASAARGLRGVTT